MHNHWPILVAAILISAAVALGLWRREQIIDAASRQQIVTTQPQPVKAEAEPAASQITPPVVPQAAQSTAAPQSPTPLPLPTPLPTAPAAPAAVTATPAAPTAPAAPAAAPAANPATPPAPKFSTPSTPPPAAAPAAAQAKPAAAAPAIAKAASPSAQALFDFRLKLEEALSRKSSDLATGGYAFQLDGARIEVQPMPGWSIIIYNINAAQADTETDNFKKLVTLAGAQLGFDSAQKGTTLASGKSVLQAATKLGSATIERDPANGKLLIQPNQRGVNAATTAAPKAVETLKAVEPPKVP